jgi:hypothetical protein
MHVAASADGLCRDADDLAVAPHRLAGRERSGRDLVAGRHEVGDDDACFDEIAMYQLPARNDDVVVGM